MVGAQQRAILLQLWYVDALGMLPMVEQPAVTMSTMAAHTGRSLAEVRNCLHFWADHGMAELVPIVRYDDGVPQGRCYVRTKEGEQWLSPEDEEEVEWLSV